MPPRCRASVEARWRPPYNAPPSRWGWDCIAGLQDNPLTNYDFALARREALTVVAGQGAIAGVVALICGAASGAAAALAAAVGGGIGATASLALVASSFRRPAAGDAQAIARGFYRGEALKLAVTVLLFGLALRAWKLAPGPLIAGYVASFAAYWAALARSAGRARRDSAAFRSGRER